MTRSSPPAPIGRSPTPRPRSSTSSGSGGHLLGMRVAPHAAISTSVDLVRSESGPGPAGFTNAVLRKVSAHDLEAWLTRLDADRATRFSHPDWVVEALTEAVGEAEIDALLEADNAAPSVTLVARPGRATPSELPGTPTVYSPYSASSPPAATRGRCRPVADGRAGVQDEGSQLVALALALLPSRARTPAGSTSAPDPAARRRCWPPSPPSAAPASWRTSCSRIAPTWYAERWVFISRLIDEGGGRRGGHRRRRDRGAVGPRLLRPGPGRCSLHRPRCPPTSARGALAASARGPRCSAPAPAGPSGRRRRPGPPLGGVVVYATCSPVLSETRDVVGSLLVKRDDVKLGNAWR